METINNIATAAAQAVWPENENNERTENVDSTTNASGPKQSATYGSTTDTTNTDTGAAASSSEEPLSGVLGDTSRGEPYDAGNKDEQDAVRADKAAGTDSYDNSGGSNNRAGTSKEAGATGMKDSKVPSSTGDDASEDKLSGPGPRPVNEVALEHGGDAGQVDSGDAAGRGSSADSGKDVGEGGPQSHSTGEGTGEKYVRSTGLKADGGDFDAAREGAGREADRLLEEKGVVVGERSDKSESDTGHEKGGSHGGHDNHHDHHDHEQAGDANSTASGQKEKKSLGNKIKEKIRRSS